MAGAGTGYYFWMDFWLFSGAPWYMPGIWPIGNVRAILNKPDDDKPSQMKAKPIVRWTIWPCFDPQTKFLRILKKFKNFVFGQFLTFRSMVKKFSDFLGIKSEFNQCEKSSPSPGDLIGVATGAISGLRNVVLAYVCIDLLYR